MALTRLEEALAVQRYSVHMHKRDANRTLNTECHCDYLEEPRKVQECLFRKNLELQAVCLWLLPRFSPS